MQLSYEIDLGFARRTWAAGNEQAGQFTGEAIFLTARPLIIFSGPDGPAEVEIRGPTDWRVSAPLMTAFCLDGDIRERTSDQRSLRDVMTAMYERYGADRRPFLASDLYEVIFEIAGVDMTSFFTRYVEGDETLPIETCLGRFGLAATMKPYAGEAYLRRDRSNRAGLRRLHDLLH